ncbi:MAG: tRNA-uridine aminocarboxypropyltransferase [Alphaproteobacteria bacterium]
MTSTNPKPARDPKPAHAASEPAQSEAVAAEPCPHCLKPPVLCVCEAVTPLDNRVALLVLQHPQEQDRLIGTARLAALNLKNATFKVGLSWPSLSKALGQEADPGRWAVLYLGSTQGAELPPDREVVVLDKKGIAEPDQDRALAGLRGIIVFDGTWAQAKTLWWRNAWILKARRLVLNPRAPSLYGKLRKEPRREGLSTIEAVALTLSRLERRPEIETTLTASFSAMLDKYRAALKAGLIEGPSAKGGRRPRVSANGKPDWRRRPARKA